MKIGYIIDSSSGISEEEAKKKGWGFLPLYISINEKEYADGSDITAKKFYETIKFSDQIRTSATPLGKIIDIYKKFSTKYEKVIVYGLSKELSSQTSNLKNFSKDFKNIHVIDSKGIGLAISKTLEEAELMNKEGKEFKYILEKLEKTNNSMYGLALPQTMKWLVKGGRVSSKAAAMANLISIVPIIKLQNGKLDKYGKGRVFEKSVIKTAKALKKEVHTDSKFLIYKGSFKGDTKIIEKAKEVLGNIEVAFLPPVVALHTGPEIICFISYK